MASLGTTKYSFDIDPETIAYLRSIGTSERGIQEAISFAESAMTTTETTVTSTTRDTGVASDSKSCDDEVEAGSSSDYRFAPRVRNSKLDLKKVIKAYNLKVLFPSEDKTVQGALVSCNPEVIDRAFSEMATATAEVATTAAAETSTTAATTSGACGTEKSKFIKSLSDMKLTPLHVAAMLGDIERAKLLVHMGATTSARDLRGWTVLHHAALTGNELMLAILEANSSKTTRALLNHRKGTYQDLLELTHPNLPAINEFGYIEHDRPTIDPYSLIIDWREPFESQAVENPAFKKGALKEAKNEPSSSKKLVSVAECRLDIAGRVSSIGNALFAIKNIEAKTLLGFYGGDATLVDFFPKDGKSRYSLGFDNLAFNGEKIGGHTTRMNHSFPNVVRIIFRDFHGMPGECAFYAASEISKDEQLCFDYGKMQPSEERLELRPKAAAEFIDWLGKSVDVKRKAKKKKGKRAAKKAGMTNLENIIDKMKSRKFQTFDLSFDFLVKVRQLMYVLSSPMHCISAFKKGIIKSKHFSKSQLCSTEMFSISLNSDKELNEWIVQFLTLTTSIPEDLRGDVGDVLEQIYDRYGKVKVVRRAIFQIIKALHPHQKTLRLDGVSEHSSKEVEQVRGLISSALKSMERPAKA